MTKRLIIAVGLVCAVAFSVTGCKSKHANTAKTGSGSESELLPNNGGGLSTSETGTGRPDVFTTGTNTAGQFDTVLFAYDSAQVEDAERAKVETVAEYLKSNPKANIILEGNCDERGSTEYNMALGERRALAARSYLMNLGVDAARLQTKSNGKERPKDAGHNEASWRVNRRVEFMVVQ